MVVQFFILTRKNLKLIKTFKFFRKNSFKDLYSQEKNLFMDGAKVYDFVNYEVIKLLKSIISKKQKNKSFI